MEDAMAKAAVVLLFVFALVGIGMLSSITKIAAGTKSGSMHMPAGTQDAMKRSPAAKKTQRPPSGVREPGKLEVPNIK
jgi:hypothetical protein